VLSFPCPLNSPVRSALDRDFTHAIAGSDALVEVSGSISLGRSERLKPPHGMAKHIMRYAFTALCFP
jgi:hypothetical protein